MTESDDLPEERNGELIMDLQPMAKQDNITLKSYISQSIKSSNHELDLSKNSCSRVTIVDAPLNAERGSESPVGTFIGEGSFKSNTATDIDASFSCKCSHGYKQNVDREDLEDLVFNAKNRKENLAEPEEALARCTNEGVAKSGLETLKKLENLQQMLSCAKEANDAVSDILRASWF